MKKSECEKAAERKKAAADPNSIGNILMQITDLSREQLGSALDYKDRHDDMWVGEVCVRMDFVSRAKLDAAIDIQKAAKNGGARTAMRLAIDRTKELSASVRKHVEVGHTLTGKLAR